MPIKFLVMMQHVKDIQILVSKGEKEDAHEALDKLLSLGPGNLEALRLKSILFAAEGKFAEEAKMWEKIIVADNEDLEAIYYFQQHHLEQRESFYFTDHLAEGGRRFITHPRALINASLGGLAGCLVFLLISNLAQQYYFIATPIVSFASFALCVLLPWVFILIAYFRAVREVILTTSGIEFKSRARNTSLKWDDISDIYIAHKNNPEEEETLLLVFEPKQIDGLCIEIDLSKETSSIRARRCFIEEIARLFKQPIYTEYNKLPFKAQRQFIF